MCVCVFESWVLSLGSQYTMFWHWWLEMESFLHTSPSPLPSFIRHWHHIHHMLSMWALIFFPLLCFQFTFCINILLQIKMPKMPKATICLHIQPEKRTSYNPRLCIRLCFHCTGLRIWFMRKTHEYRILIIKCSSLCTENKVNSFFLLLKCVRFLTGCQVNCWVTAFV